MISGDNVQVDSGIDEGHGRGNATRAGTKLMLYRMGDMRGVRVGFWEDIPIKVLEVLSLDESVVTRGGGAVDSDGVLVSRDAEAIEEKLRDHALFIAFTPAEAPRIAVAVVGKAANGEEALQLAVHTRPDLITLDLEMPRMDGFTLLRIIMAKSPIPIIVVSSYAQQDNIFKALELGAFDFIAKPDILMPGDIIFENEPIKKPLSGACV